MAQNHGAKIHFPAVEILVTPVFDAVPEVDPVPASHYWSTMASIGLVPLPNGNQGVVDAQTGVVYAEARRMVDLLPWLEDYASEFDSLSFETTQDAPVGEAIAWQADVYGQRVNDMFLARFCDEHEIPVLPPSVWRTWMAMVSNYYDVPDEYMDSPTDDMEKALDERGYQVVWDGGVHIYQTPPVETPAPVGVTAAMCICPPVLTEGEVPHPVEKECPVHGMPKRARIVGTSRYGTVVREAPKRVIGEPGNYRTIPHTAQIRWDADYDGPRTWHTVNFVSEETGELVVS